MSRVTSRIEVDVCSSREDYQKYNDVQLEELEVSYQAKLDVLRAQLEKNVEQIDPEEAKELIEENQLLERKLGKIHLLLDQRRDASVCRSSATGEKPRRSGRTESRRR